MSRRTNLYIAATCGIAGMAWTAVFVLLPSPSRAGLTAIVCLGALALLAEFLAYSYSVLNGAAGSIAFIPNLAAAIIAPSWAVVLAASSAYLIPALVGKRNRTKVVFNAAQVSLATSLAILAYHLAGGESLLRLRLTLQELVSAVAAPFALLTIVFFFANALAVTGAITISQDRSFATVWREMTRGRILYDVLSSPAVLLLAWVYVGFGAAWATVLVIPMLGVRQLYKTNYELERVNRDLLELMVKAIEARDPYTSGHSRRVSHYAQLIARAVGLDSRSVERVGIAALLHDVGKIHEVYAPILRNPGKLSPEEWTIMQTHPVKSAELVSTVSHLADIVAPVLHHHENWDGTGYPHGLAADAIPVASRIILFADTIDAMTTDRPYRKALTETEVRRELLRQRGTQFDPHICDLLLASSVFGLLFAPPLRGPEGSPVGASTPAKAGPAIMTA